MCLEARDFDQPSDDDDDVHEPTGENEFQHAGAETLRSLRKRGSGVLTVLTKEKKRSARLGPGNQGRDPAGLTG